MTIEEFVSNSKRQRKDPFKVKSSIEERWTERILRGGLEKRGRVAAVRYMSSWGRNMKTVKAVDLALCAEAKGFQDVANGFWEEAYRLETGVRASYSGVGSPNLELSQEDIGKLVSQLRGRGLLEFLERGREMGADVEELVSSGVLGGDGLQWPTRLPSKKSGIVIPDFFRCRNGMGGLEMTCPGGWGVEVQAFRDEGAIGVKDKVSVQVTLGGKLNDTPLGAASVRVFAIGGGHVFLEKETHCQRGLRWDPDKNTPAFRKFFPNGALYTEQHYIEGINRARDRGVPASVFYYENGIVAHRIFKDAEGKEHRDAGDGAADEGFDEAGRKVRGVYYEHGRKLAAKEIPAAGGGGSKRGVDR